MSVPYYSGGQIEYDGEEYAGDPDTSEWADEIDDSDSEDDSEIVDSPLEI